MAYRGGGREYTRGFKVSVAVLAVLVFIDIVLAAWMGSTSDQQTAFTLMEILVFIVVLTGAFALILFGNTRYYQDEGL